MASTRWITGKPMGLAGTSALHLQPAGVAFTHRRNGGCAMRSKGLAGGRFG